MSLPSQTELFKRANQKTSRSIYLSKESLAQGVGCSGEGPVPLLSK